MRLREQIQEALNAELNKNGLDIATATKAQVLALLDSGDIQGTRDNTSALGVNSVQDVRLWAEKLMYEYTTLPVDELIPYVNNSRTHSEEQVTQIASSMKEFGFTNPVLVDEENGIIAGHGRIMAAKKIGISEVPCIVLSGLTEAQKKAYIIADNQLPLNAGWDLDTLKLEIENLKELDFDIDVLGFDDSFLDDMFDDDGELYADGIKGQMSSDFGFSPFTVFNGREGGWQKRKDSGKAKGIESEVGRDIKDTITMSESIGKDKDKGGLYI